MSLCPAASLVCKLVLAEPRLCSPKTVAASTTYVFPGAQHDRNARRTGAVIAITASMMVVEVAAGTYYGSMALGADGWHMSTHAAVLMITALTIADASDDKDDLTFMTDAIDLGSVSMRSFVFHAT